MSIPTRRAAPTPGLLALVLVGVVHGDTYLHNPRGSNNRLNERSANRNNGNRMFDSQVRPSALIYSSPS